MVRNKIGVNNMFFQANKLENEIVARFELNSSMAVIAMRECYTKAAARISVITFTPWPLPDKIRAQLIDQYYT